MAMTARDNHRGPVKMSWGTLQPGFASLTLSGGHDCLASVAMFAYGDMETVLQETGRDLRDYWSQFWAHTRSDHAETGPT